VLSSGALETKGPFNMSAPLEPAPFECAPPLLIRLQKLENRAGPALWQNIALASSIHLPIGLI
jgi:hypothetical protein